MVAIETIIGYVLFIVSEFVSLIPIPANGLLHSFTIGFKNSFKNPDINAEMTQSLLKKNPNIATLVNKIANNIHITNSLSTLLEKPQILSQINTISNNNKLQYIITLLNNHPEMINDISNLIEKQILSQNQNNINQTLNLEIPQQIIPNLASNVASNDTIINLNPENSQTNP
jgi:hypothetical protein